MGAGRRFVLVTVALGLVPGLSQAQITRVATFENFAAGQAFQPSFTDPLSGITFRDSTQPPAGGFVIDHSATYFGGGNYLTAGAGPEEALGSFVGFTGDLPSPASAVELDVIYLSGSSHVLTLTGYDSAGILVASTTATRLANPFSVEINSGRFNIKTFKVVVVDGDQGYNNISYTIVPEPGMGFVAIGVAVGVIRRRR